MPYAYPEIKNFRGLYLQRNSLTVPDGGLEIAENIIIKSDDLISPRRGYYSYFTPVSGSLNKLFTYQSKLLAAYQTKFSYYTDAGLSPNETGTESVLSGETVSITNNRVCRSLETNKNFYFSTDNGILKLTAYNSVISKSGAPQGLDVISRFSNTATSTSWFFFGTGTVSATVGYRCLFGYQDSNANLILGAPSQISVLTNVLVDIGAGNAAAAGTTVTVTSTAHGLITGQYVVVPAGSASGFTTSANAEGTWQITVTGANTFTYVSTIAPGGGPGTLKYLMASPVRVEFSVPTEISTALPWFVQVYRSSVEDAAVGVLSDFALVTQRALTSAEITAGVGFFDDSTPSDFLGAELYTNENSREGELQANYRAPLALDMTLFLNQAIYANCTTRHLINLSLVAPGDLASGDYVEVKVNALTRRYVARGGVGNKTVVGLCSSSAGILITYASHGLVNGDTVYIANIVGGTLTAGTYYVVAAAANTFKISLTSGGAAISYNGETSLEFEGVTDGTYSLFTLSSSSSASVQLRDSAEGLVKAVNRDSSGVVYAQYTSGPTDVPGQMRFQAKGFGGSINFRASSTLAGQAFFPVLPSSFASGTQVFSTNESLPNECFVSKIGEPEAVPLLNFIVVGAANKAIIRIHALRDSIIVLKEDGVFRVTGDNVNNFNVTILDSTIKIIASSSADVLNNQVVFLSNQGICLVTESSVQIISRNIEDVIQPILGQANIATVTAAAAYESERLYLITTSQPNDTSASVVYAYNILTDSWTTWTTLFLQGLVGPSDNFYYIGTDNTIQKERKKQTNLDYTGQNYAATITNVSSDLMSCDITLGSGVTPEAGDVILKSDILNRVNTDPVLISGTTFTVTFKSASNLANADSLFLYSRYIKKIKTVPFHAGLTGRVKHFGQMLLSLRNEFCTRLYINFFGDTYGGSETSVWESLLSSSGANGWGLFPWGFEPWGQSTQIYLTQGTRPGPMVRIWVPRFQARNTFLQAYLEHREAAEPFGIQALSYTVRAYGERSSR